MKKMRYIIPVMSFVLTLACAAPMVNSTIFPSHSPAPSIPSVQMIVKVDEGLNIRTGAGEKYPLVDGENVLHDGDVVNCHVFVTVGDSVWCGHEKGYSNARWMVVYNTTVKK